MDEATGLFCLPGLKVIFPCVVYIMAILECNSEYSHKEDRKDVLYK